MNSTLISNIVRFILLIAVQVIILNKINLFGFINPFPYILFILLYPVNTNQAGLLVSSFLLGLSIDYFDNSGGIHATACLILAYLRPSFFKFAFGLSYEYQTIRINDRLSPERFTFILISIITHHLVLFTLEFFKFVFMLDALIRTLFASLFTLIVSIIFIYLFKPSKR
ncbi:rod shape-determining protein MreD [Flavobacterium columnare NBRC 100251 = ATCC 23463]|uniref:rod shape-determining protein MreD n=1 Tax=Flavobacterium columnare TaxID=996 RepID=UPI0002D27617|nr:rod shape-determining protein MreD [Flavobacterium columnare]MBF6652062.1 rod shape-determining protein MreD [Flavobacterium columnare]MBF6655938.1 rod shape-determining protein MreD [Flavobacterium columnare]MBF6658807.1 rod shape-determining protein MreD [Flavobacterium columnare]OOB82940.1 rod shape-determining protein MreD [Flavobacterium columnare]PDS24041.1 rod shape-determining protein MreD [Flavobacterium columnare NBRC 100251 = ATCC 23463]